MRTKKNKIKNNKTKKKIFEICNQITSVENGIEEKMPSNLKLDPRMIFTRL